MPLLSLNNDVVKATDDKQFCLLKDPRGNYIFNAYFYQVQTRIVMCSVEYCDFVVCTFPKGQHKPKVHQE